MPIGANPINKNDQSVYIVFGEGDIGVSTFGDDMLCLHQLDSRHEIGSAVGEAGTKKLSELEVGIRLIFQSTEDLDVVLECLNRIRDRLAQAQSAKEETN